MATKTTKKTKAESGKKAAHKRGEKRDETPALECPYVANLTRPLTTEATGKLAEKLPGFVEAAKAWKASVREAFTKANAEGVAADLPIFPPGKFINLNAGQMTRKAIETLEDEGDVLPSRYNPVIVDAIHVSNAVSLRKGSTSRFWNEEREKYVAPKDWDADKYGSWWLEWTDDDGKVQRDPSGWRLDQKMPRRCHAVTAESMIDNHELYILTFGNLRIVCGTGSHDNAAAFNIWQTKRGNYRAGDETRKRQSLAGNKAVRDVVFKIEDRPNNGGGFTVKGGWANVREMVYMPGQVLTAGNLYDSKGKMLTAKEIRALDGDTKGLRFKSLSEPIVGKVIPWAKLWAEIKVADKPAITKMRRRGGRSGEFEAGNVETKSITNICVNGRRVDPSEAFPFGLKGGQSHMPAYVVATGEGKIEEGYFGMGVVIGERANEARNVGVHEARGGSEIEAEAEAEAPAPKPKAAKKAKPKADKKATKPKAEKKAKPEVEPKPDAAPPVESDTVDDPEPVTVDAEDETEVVGADSED